MEKNSNNFIKKALENNKVSLEAKGLYMFLVMCNHIDASNYNHFHKESLDTLKLLLEELYNNGLVSKSVSSSEKKLFYYVPITSK
jgi:hypothetical protein